MVQGKHNHQGKSNFDKLVRGIEKHTNPKTGHHYSEESAENIAGAINRDYVHHYRHVTNHHKKQGTGF